VAALANRSAAPKIIYVDGTIDANVDDAGRSLGCAEYATDGYTLDAYLAAYDPLLWGRDSLPSGPLESARVASQKVQEKRVRIRIGSNTTIVGLDKQARIRGAWFDIRDAGNIIVRNLHFEDTFDCFPQWDPTDGSSGNWNSAYDSISLRNTRNVWIDHNTFADVLTADENAPEYFGRLFQQHDGLADITNASDLVTVSWNRFLSHDKVMLIGSSDSATADRGKLRVTLHHNLFEDVNQRAPRVRFGQVHVYNNLYKIERTWRYGGSWTVGVESAIVADNNFFRVDDTVSLDRIIGVSKGKVISESGTLLDGPADKNLTSLTAIYNAARDPDLGTDAGWVPTLVAAMDRTRHVLPAVQAHAGPLDPLDE
jgi:pectate lyase